MADSKTLDQLCINTIRTLSMDAVQAANSGHPGTPMALAPVAYCLWQHFLRFDPDDPIWPNRDRFVLSVGHASMLLYSLLHLTGVKAVNPEYEVLGQPAVTLEDIKRFRELDSKCPGHPEYRWTSGVEATTGPLGQGITNSVGMAIAGRWLAATFNRPNFALFDHDVYALCSDGDLMEGVVARPPRWPAISTSPTSAGSMTITTSPSRGTLPSPTVTTSRHVLSATAGTSRESATPTTWRCSARAFATFKATDDRPTLIIVDSHIGYGAPHKHDTSAAHGHPLGEEEIRLAKRNYGWPEEAKFLVPDGVREHFQAGVGRRGADARAAWFAIARAYRDRYPVLADQLDQLQRRELPDGWDRDLPTFAPDAERHGHSRVVRAGAQRHRQKRALAYRRRGRPRSVDQYSAHLRRGRRFRGRQLRRAQLSLRDPRARDVRHPEWDGAQQGAAVWRHLPDLQRLRAPRDPARRVHADSRSSSCSRTTRSRWARTGRPISRSSSLPR